MIQSWQIGIGKVQGELQNTERCSIHKIFFECSRRKKFSSQIEKEIFFSHWTDYYTGPKLRDIFLATDEKQDIAGYLMGHDNSFEAVSFFKNRVPSYLIFKNLFSRFPAHLHINCSPNFQGVGVGKKLIDSYIEELKKRGAKGLHVVTSPDARNVQFYKKAGFEFHQEGKWEKSKLFFMGLDLT